MITNAPASLPAPGRAWRAVVLCAALLPTPHRALAESDAELDRVVAVVNNGVVVMSELRKQMDSVLAELRRAGNTPPPRPVLERQVLDRLILEKLQLQAAAALKIRVADAALNNAVASVAKRNKLSLSEFRKILESDGLDFAVFREEIRKQMLLARIQQRQVSGRVRVREREVDAYLESRKAAGERGISEYRLSHILIAVPGTASESERAKIELHARQILQRLHAGEDFAAVAAAESDAEGAAENGGDLGWRAPDKIPSIFTDVVPRLRPGEVSDLIRSPSGFHIVTVTEVREKGRHMVRQTKAQHILIRTDEVTSDEDARTRLEQLREHIINGASFGRLARSHSDDRGSAVKDGNLGWLNPGDTVPAFQAAMDLLAPGEISQPFKSSFGWHIVRVLARRDFDNSEQIERSEARAAIRKRKIGEELQGWLRQLRDEAYVEYRLEE